VPGGGQEAGGGHSPFAVPADQRERAGADAGAVARQGAKLDVGCAGNMPGAVFGILADVQDRAADLPGRDQADAPGRPGPRGHASGQLAGEVLVADLHCLADEAGAVLGVVEDEHEGLAGIGEPAEPGSEGVAKRDRQRARDVPRSEGRDRAGVNEAAAAGHHAAHLVCAERSQRRRLRAVDGGPAPVDLAQPAEVRRVGAQAGEELGDKGVLARRGEQRVGRLLPADGGHPFRAGGSRTK
jgi:hypothetical protein